MYYVYLLQSKSDGKIYTGYTNNLKRRVKQHISQEVHTTHRMKNIELIYYEAFTNKQDAKERERYLKTTQGKRTLKLMLMHTFAAIV